MVRLTSVLLVLCLRIPNCLYDHSWFGTFEEINLRFYVVRKEGNTVKRGVVFINETIPYPIVALMANKLYNEHYMWCLQNTKLVMKAQQKK
jgi:uncharacterized protein YqjF (DUF2071 family)